ncbi:hypothetical protein COCSADRAFT_31830 [Bipolaris sorokiniana ND90Pr]|uniref:Transmembrane protein n=1 Tax=Cochliobolus sativus (strain ND90Pr / ATCC 201652) TaxID=665912 RepID=M2SPB7_COCSN|nr:uncharacterized protein COCSADRAFT_31830 [Bipolaris sorokiniana ND90Pr]EMD69053.1 hypothetical protein COCSADRAFT_31830 [Bipolaris sorokiniana ND90Pr]
MGSDVGIRTRDVRGCEKIAGKEEFVWFLFVSGVCVYGCMGVWIMWITFCERDSSHTSIWRVVKRPTERTTTRGNMYMGVGRGPNLHFGIRSTLLPISK